MFIDIHRCSYMFIDCHRLPYMLIDVQRFSMLEGFRRYTKIEGDLLSCDVKWHFSALMFANVSLQTDPL